MSTPSCASVLPQAGSAIDDAFLHSHRSLRSAERMRAMPIIDGYGRMCAMKGLPGLSPGRLSCIRATHVNQMLDSPGWHASPHCTGAFVRQLRPESARQEKELSRYTMVRQASWDTDAFARVHERIAAGSATRSMASCKLA